MRIPSKTVFLLKRDAGSVFYLLTWVTWEHSHPMREDVTYITFSLIGWECCHVTRDNIDSQIKHPEDMPISSRSISMKLTAHDDVIKWKHFPCYWPFVRGIHRSPLNSPHKGQWRRALMFSFICAWISGWVNNREIGDLRCHGAHCDVIVMIWILLNLRLGIVTLFSCQVPGYMSGKLHGIIHVFVC